MTRPHLVPRLAGFGTGVLSEVAALSLLLALIALGGLLLNGWLGRRKDVRVAALATAAPAWSLGRARPIAEGVCWFALFFVLALPFAALAATAEGATIGMMTVATRRAKRAPLIRAASSRLGSICASAFVTGRSASSRKRDR